jgi:hypothetical protein
MLEIALLRGFQYDFSDREIIFPGIENF